MTTDAGSIVTVDGHVDPSALGPTLPHEHLFIDIAETWYEPPDSAYHRRLAQQPVSLDTLWYIRRNLYQHEENMRLDSFEEAVDEVARFQRAGGGAIVDLTPKNTGGDPELVRALSRQTGVDVVHGTAYYTRPAHPASIDDRSIDDLAAEFVSDVRDGIDDTDVRAGIVGEIGVSGRIHDQEERVVRAGLGQPSEPGRHSTSIPPVERPTVRRIALIPRPGGRSFFSISSRRKDFPRNGW